MLAGRYRIVGLLGKGGMGEVYKAEDLKLQQIVALKFLPDAIALDSGMLARFHNEVRIARQVSHPAVCRVYDIGEEEGRPFLSMEFIDGEDLATLLRRIGRLPGDKAIELARQMCAGLAAAHDNGVLHRDFKPANVMIDGRGRARITDFGLAVVSADLHGDDVLAGTPAYMAPEQLTGKQATQRSDIYALGLVLYELFTGKRVFEAKSLNELRLLHEQSTPATPSSYVKDMDPLVERVILRCLEKEPHARPGSAIQVAAMLPGGDPLAAALAAGETPSPEMVAAAGEKTGLRPMVAVACLMAVFAGLVALAFLGRRVTLIERIPFEHSPEVLAGKGREAIAQLGYPERPFDRAYGLNYGYDYLEHIEKDTATDWRRHLESGRGGAVYLWYRESPDYLQPFQPTDRWGAWTANEFNPPPLVPGMRGVKLDTLGRMREFYARPPRVDEAKSAAPAPDWNKLFILADLDSSRFTAAEARWNPDSAFDARAAWTGTATDTPDIPLRVEAAGYHGRVVFFKLIGPWTTPNQTRSRPPAFLAFVRVGILVGAALLAWRNYRQGKGDLQGALRLAVLSFVFRMLFWILSADHVPNSDEVSVLAQGVGVALFLSARVWVFYMALEPYVRRRWPTRLISWSRVLAGKFTDPLVGRDFLVGILIGLGFTLVVELFFLTALQPATNVELDLLLGVRAVAGDFFHSAGGAVFDPLAFTVLFTLLRALLRRDWLAGAVVMLISMLPGLLSSSLPGAVRGLMLGSLLVLAFLRFGLLTLAASLLIFFWLNSLPFTTNLAAWYAGPTIFAMFLVMALAGSAFYTSLGGQKVFAGKLLED